jgi:hypothetical protein
LVEYSFCDLTRALALLLITPSAILSQTSSTCVLLLSKRER